MKSWRVPNGEMVTFEENEAFCLSEVGGSSIIVDSKDIRDWVYNLKPQEHWIGLDLVNSFLNCFSHNFICRVQVLGKMEAPWCTRVGSMVSPIGRGHVLQRIVMGIG